MIKRGLRHNWSIRSSVLYGLLWLLFASSHLFRVVLCVISGGSQLTNPLFFIDPFVSCSALSTPRVGVVLLVVFFWVLLVLMSFRCLRMLTGWCFYFVYIFCWTKSEGICIWVLVFFLEWFSFGPGYTLTFGCRRFGIVCLYIFLFTKKCLKSFKRIIMKYLL